MERLQSKTNSDLVAYSSMQSMRPQGPGLLVQQRRSCWLDLHNSGRRDPHRHRHRQRPLRHDFVLNCRRTGCEPIRRHRQRQRRRDGRSVRPMRWHWLLGSRQLPLGLDVHRPWQRLLQTVSSLRPECQSCPSPARSEHQQSRACPGSVIVERRTSTLVLEAG